MPYGIITIGPAGVGKTTMAHAMQVHGRLHKRGIYVVNMDPAAELLPYEADVDVRELITITDAMKEFGYGPNGGLVYCMEFVPGQATWTSMRLQLDV